MSKLGKKRNQWTEKGKINYKFQIRSEVIGNTYEEKLKEDK